MKLENGGEHAVVKRGKVLAVMLERNGTEIVEESAWCHLKKISLLLSFALLLSSVSHPFSP